MISQDLDPGCGVEDFNEVNIQSGKGNGIFGNEIVDPIQTIEPFVLFVGTQETPQGRYTLCAF